MAVLARRLDRTLPARDTLPWWGKHGRGMAPRRAALYLSPALQMGLTLLILLSTLFDSRADAQLLTAGKLLGVGAVFSVVPIMQLLQVAGYRRWIGEGQPDYRQSMTAKLASHRLALPAIIAAGLAIAFLANLASAATG